MPLLCCLDALPQTYRLFRLGSYIDIFMLYVPCFITVHQMFSIYYDICLYISVFVYVHLSFIIMIVIKIIKIKNKMLCLGFMYLGMDYWYVLYYTLYMYDT